MLDYLIIGKNGQVGSALAKIVKGNILALGRDEINLANISDINHTLSNHKAKIVINAAAYTQVDKAEEERELAMAINAIAVGEIARFCAANNQIFIHYSTDYVFPGNKQGAWKEEDKVSPPNYYGITKLRGEEEIVKAGGKYLIFRTSWVYDKFGKNFFNTMLRLAETRDEISVVNDQEGSPTYAADLAIATLEIAEKAVLMGEFPAGIYHLSGQGKTNWYEFACAILQDRNIKINPIPSSAYPTPAKRPANSLMDNSKVKEIFGYQMPKWEESLKLVLL